jgi:glycosyltransferase involved in cell wall biosynthesis
VAFGTWGPSDGRPRATFEAFEHLGWRLERCHALLFASSSAKVDAVRGRGGTGRTLLRAVGVYALLALRALCRLPFDCLVVTSGGYLDILAGWLPARVAGAVLVFDPLYGLYETVVDDRGLVRPGTAAAGAVRLLERLCFRLADVVVTDTTEHRRDLVRRIGLAPRRVLVVPVGADDAVFQPGPARDDRPQGGQTVEVLFYGTMIPLHGAETIVRAAARLADAPVRFTLIGKGQTSGAVERLARDLGCRNVRFLDAVPFADLPGRIAEADICLGIFGTTQKARDVVPTKVYQCLAMGKPVVTGDTPAVRTLFRPGEHLVTVPCGDGERLAQAVGRLAADPARRRALGRAGRAWYEANAATAARARRLRPIEAWIA